MPNTQFSSLEGVKADANLVQTSLVNSKARLFKQGFLPNPSTVAADYAAQECDFDNYAEKTIAAWGEPVLATDASGYMILAPTQTWIWEFDTDAVENIVGGYWIELAGGTVVAAVIFGTPVPMQGPDQATVVTPVMVWATGP